MPVARPVSPRRRVVHTCAGGRVTSCNPWVLVAAQVNRGRLVHELSVSRTTGDFQRKIALLLSLGLSLSLPPGNNGQHSTTIEWAQFVQWVRRARRRAMHAGAIMMRACHICPGTWRTLADAQVHTNGGGVGRTARPGSGEHAWEREALRLEAEKTVLSEANVELAASAETMRHALEDAQAKLSALQVRPIHP